jgi:urease accessory protein
MRSVRHCIPAALASGQSTTASVALGHAARARCRQRVVLDDGDELAIALAPGTVLAPGDVLVAEDDVRYRVVAKAEPVLRITSADPWLMQRAAYHLGNRHTPVAVLRDALLIEPDPVLADMLRRLGVQVAAVEAAFEPERGAYGGGHRHGHDATFAEDQALAQAVFERHSGAAATAPLARGPRRA